MQTQAFTYVIVGNSAAGLAALEAIRAIDKQSSIALVSKEPHPAYGRPLISYLLEGKTTYDALWLRPADFYEKQAVTCFFGESCTAVALDAQAKTLTLANGSVLSYEECLIATGSRSANPVIEGISQASTHTAEGKPALGGFVNVQNFLTLDDAQALREALEATENPVGCVAVMGGGLTGLKAAEALAGYTKRVLVFKRSAPILSGVLDQGGAQILTEQLAEHGIECRIGTSISAVQSEGNRVVSATLSDGSNIAIDALVLATGVKANAELAVEAGAQAQRGLVVDRFMQTTLEHVYAAGDATQVQDVLDGTTHTLQLWPNAVRQGTVAGYAMARSVTGKAPKLPQKLAAYDGGFAVNAVDFFGIPLITAGMVNPKDAAEYSVIVRVDNAARSYAKYVVRDDVLVGYILLNCSQRAGMLTALIENHVPLSSLEQDPFEGAPTLMMYEKGQRQAKLHGIHSCE